MSVLIDSELERWEEAAILVAMKANRLKMAIVGWASAAVLLFVSTLVGGT